MLLRSVILIIALHLSIESSERKPSGHLVNANSQSELIYDQIISPRSPNVTVMHITSPTLLIAPSALPTTEVITVDTEAIMINNDTTTVLIPKDQIDTRDQMNQEQPPLIVKKNSCCTPQGQYICSTLITFIMTVMIKVLADNS